MEVPSEIVPLQMEGAGVKPCRNKFCNGDRNVTWHMCLAKCPTRHLPEVSCQIANKYSLVVYVGSIRSRPRACSLHAWDSLEILWTQWIHTGIVAPSTLPSSLKSFSVQDNGFFLSGLKGLRWRFAWISFTSNGEVFLILPAIHVKVALLWGSRHSN